MKQNETLAHLIPLLQQEDILPLFNARCTKLEHLCDQMHRTHAEIRSACVKLSDQQSFEKDVDAFDAFNQCYYEIIAAKQSVSVIEHAKKEVSASSESSISSPGIRLPPLDLPTFNGNKVEWPHFYDTFLSMVHSNASLTDIDRLHYLRLWVQGEPKSIVATLPLLAKNYAIAWGALKERYHNHRSLAEQYLSNILTIKKLLNDPSLAALQQFYTAARDNSTGLSYLQIARKEDFILLNLMLNNVDTQLRESFELQYADIEFPTLDNFLTFLRRRCVAMENVHTANPKSKSNAPPVNCSSGRAFVSAVRNAVPKCPYCELSHKLLECAQFLKLSAAGRHAFVKTHNFCFNCLGIYHKLPQCSSKQKCRICNAKHHTLLHLDAVVSSGPGMIPSSNDPTISASGHAQVLSCSTHSTVLLGTVQAHIRDSDGNLLKIRLVIDCGSQLSFTTQRCVDRLNLLIQESRISITGVDQVNVPLSRGKITCGITSRLSNPNSSRLLVDAMIIPSITTDLPIERVSSQILSEVACGTNRSQYSIWMGDLRQTRLSGCTCFHLFIVHILLRSSTTIILAGRRTR